MKKQFIDDMFVLVLLALLGFGLASNAYGFETAIVAAPNVLNIQSEGNVVTVHTDIPYSHVYAHSVQLNGVDISSWKADARGYFVAKFLMGAVKALEGLSIGDYNTLTLTGIAINEADAAESFFGVDEVMVLDNQPVGRR